MLSHTRDAKGISLRADSNNKLVIVNSKVVNLATGALADNRLTGDGVGFGVNLGGRSLKEIGLLADLTH